jgi:hypothetical protein
MATLLGNPILPFHKTIFKTTSELPKKTSSSPSQTRILKQVLQVLLNSFSDYNKHNNSIQSQKVFFSF